jgi:hypothetical protein
MPDDEPEIIPAETASSEYGITCIHRKMPNGELRFKLDSGDGTAYIRTVSVAGSGWQKSHYHRRVQETYIVQEGWMALASLNDEKLIIELYTKSQIVTTQQMVPHNVYLPDKAVIHTVKHGEAKQKDWEQCPELDKRTEHLTEKDILDAIKGKPEAAIIDQRFSSYVDVYNNLDNLLWRIPGFFIAVAAILMAFMGSAISKPEASLPPAAWASLFLFVGILFLLGTYSMSRIRLHHSRMGNELKVLEPFGYFHTRATTVASFWPPSAPHVFMAVFTVLGFFFLFLSYAVISNFSWLGALLK